MKSFNIITASILCCLACVGSNAAERKGSVKPNAMLADFNKHDEAYYLSLDQIRVGFSAAQVEDQFGKKYTVVDSQTKEGKKYEKWKFNSYRARQFSDPIDKFVFVEFLDGVVVDATEKSATGTSQPVSLVAKGSTSVSDSVASRLQQVQSLLDQKLISEAEYAAKRKEIIDSL